MTPGASAPGGVDSRLIGREWELRELFAGLEAARDDRGRLFLLAGDAGIGKTTLVEALAEFAEPTEVRVCWGRCWEGGGSPSFWPWTQVLRAELADCEPAELRRRLGPAAPHLAPLIPDLVEALPDIVRQPLSDLPGARLALFDAFTSFLRERANEGGMLILLEDLHAADEASLRLLQAVVRELPSSHLLVVGTYRDPEVRSSPPLQQLMSSLARQGRRIMLTGLDEDSVATLLERTSGIMSLASRAREVHRTTDGNPFFVQEVARLLVSERPTAGDAGGPLPLPEEVHQLIARRLTPVPAGDREVLTVAAVLGRDFDVPALAALVGAGSGELLDVLVRAEALDVVRETGLGRWQFSHALLRETLYDQVRPSERVALHRRVGETLEALHGDGAVSHAAELAHHFFEAARGGEGARAVRWCTVAAGQSMDALAFEEAAVLYGRALEALALSPPVDERVRYDLFTGLARAKERASDFPQARETWRRAMKSARSLGSAELLAKAAIGYVGMVESKADDTRKSALEEARAALPPTDSALLAHVLVKLGLATMMDRAPSPEIDRRYLVLGRRLADDGLAMARRAGDQERLRQILWEWHFTAFPDLGLLEQRTAVARELLALALAAGDRERVALAHQWVAADLFTTGEIDEMAVHVNAALEGAKALRMPFLVWGATMPLTALALLRGQLDEAGRLADEALAAGARTDFVDCEGAYRRQTRALKIEQGRFQEVIDDVQRLLDGTPNCHHLNCTSIDVALASVHLGRREEAEALLRRLTDADVPARDQLANRLCCPAWLAELCWLLDEPGPAAVLYELLAPYHDRHVHVGVSTVPYGACARYLGQLAALMGRFDQAEAHFEAAHAMHRRMGAPGWLARGQANHARMLQLRDKPGDRERAVALATAARDGFRAVGMTHYEKRAAALLVDPAPSVPPETVGPPLDRAGLSQEGEYWAFDYAGEVVRLRDSKGVRYLARLLRNPGQELHALDLVVGDGGGPASGEEAAALRGGDAGAVLDPQAKAAYHRRLQDLREELDEADAHNDIGRAEKAQAEMDFLLAELSAAVGLGGRDRKAASDAERARQSVTRAIKGTIERLGDGHGALGLHLRSTVRTGVYSAYVPDPRAPIVWES